MPNELDNLNDIISSLSQEDIDMLKGVASSILGGQDQSSPAPKNDTTSKKGIDSLDLDSVDFNMIMKAKSIFDKMNNTPNKNADLILALKPHLKPETQMKADQALRLIKLFEILPLLKELF